MSKKAVVLALALFAFVLTSAEDLTPNNDTTVADKTISKRADVQQPPKNEGFMSKLASWIFPFGGGDSVASETHQGGGKYLPPSQNIDQDCNPCNKEPWIPVATNYGKNTIIGFMHPSEFTQGQVHHQTLDQLKPPFPNGQSYGAPFPQQNNIPFENYGPPIENLKTPKENYGPPFQTPNLKPSVDNFGTPEKLQNYIPPVTNNLETYGPPIENFGPPPTTKTYGVPQVQPLPPFKHYGPPKPFFNPPKPHFPPFKTHNVQKPRHVFGGPREQLAPSQYTNQYRPPPSKFKQGMKFTPTLATNMRPPPFNPQNFIPLHQQNNVKFPNPDYIPPRVQLPLSQNHPAHLLKPIPLPNLSAYPMAPLHGPQDFAKGSRYEASTNTYYTDQNNYNIGDGYTNQPSSNYNSNGGDVQIQQSIAVADYVASIEHPINVIHSPILELDVANTSSQSDFPEDGYRDLSNQPTNDHTVQPEIPDHFNSVTAQPESLHHEGFTVNIQPTKNYNPTQQGGVDINNYNTVNHEVTTINPIKNYITEHVGNSNLNTYNTDGIQSSKNFNSGYQENSNINYQTNNNFNPSQQNGYKVDQNVHQSTQNINNNHYSSDNNYNTQHQSNNNFNPSQENGHQINQNVHQSTQNHYSSDNNYNTHHQTVKQQKGENEHQIIQNVHQSTDNHYSSDNKYNTQQQTNSNFNPSHQINKNVQQSKQNTQHQSNNNFNPSQENGHQINQNVHQSTQNHYSSDNNYNTHHQSIKQQEGENYLKPPQQENTYTSQVKQNLNNNPKHYNNLNNEHKLSQNPIVVDDTHTAESSFNGTIQNHNVQEENTTYHQGAFVNADLINQIIKGVDFKETNQFTKPEIDYSDWLPNQELSTEMFPPPEGESFWLSSPGSGVEVTTKKPKQIQIIIPYTTNTGKVYDKNLGRKVGPNTLPLQTQPPSYESVWTEHTKNEVYKTSSSNDVYNNKKATTPVINIKDLLKTNQGDINYKNLPFDIIRFQKNIDDWTEQEYAHKMLLNIQKSTSTTRLVPSKQIPEEYLTTQPYNPKDFEVTTYSPKDLFDHEPAGTNSKEYKYKDEIENEKEHEYTGGTESNTSDEIEHNFIGTDGRVSAEVTTERQKGKVSWDQIQIAVSPLTKEKVYVVTPQPKVNSPTESWKNANLSTTFSINILPMRNASDLNDVRIVLSEWPHLINNLETTTSTSTTRPKTSRHPLFGLMDLSSYAPPDNATIQTYSGHSKVINAASSSTKKKPSGVEEKATIKTTTQKIST